MKKRDLITVISIAGLLSFFYYGPFLDNYFVWDDFMMLENYYTRNFKDFLFGFADLRLFGNCILWINCLVSGFNPIGYSLIGISAHIANSAMLFLLIYSISNDRLLSIFTAVIFAASSVGCDAIFWKCAFLTVTGLFFYLLILYLYLEGNKRRNPAFHNLALIVFFFAMFNKEEIASIPFMIIFIEMLFFRDGEGLTSKLKRVLSYFLVIVIYILLSYAISRYYVSQEQFERFLIFRPLHTLFSGFASFFISPDGRLDWEDPFAYIAALLILFSFIFIKDRKYLWFGCGWVFLTFLPQSLTGLTQYNPPYLLNSISRHLYLPSIGPAIVFSAILLSISGHFNRKVFVTAAALFLAAFTLLNFERVKDRGKQWQEAGLTMESFLNSMKKLQPSLPEDAYVRVLHGPGGRSYVTRALRAVYKNPKIYWLDEPKKDAYIFIVLNGYLLNDHESIMKLAKVISDEEVGYVMRFYELHQWETGKSEFLRERYENPSP